MLLQRMRKKLTAEASDERRAWSQSGRYAVSKCSFEKEEAGLPLSPKHEEMREEDVRSADARPLRGARAYR